MPEETNPEENGWTSSPFTPIAPMNQKRFLVACTAIDEHRLIVIGGRDDSYKLLSSCEIYDDRTKEWTYLPNAMPNAIYGCAAVSIDGKVYVIGGRTDVRSCLSQLLVLDLGTGEWEQLPPMKNKRTLCAAVAVGRFIYVFGGYKVSEYGVGFFASAECYNVDTRNWEGLPQMSTKRYGCAAAVVGGKIHVVGGWNGETRLATVEVFDVESKTWDTTSSVPNMSTPRTGCAAVALGQFLVVNGGYDNDDNLLSSVEVYEIGTRYWKKLPKKMSTPRAYFGAAILGEDQLVIAGGFTSMGLCTDCVEQSSLPFPNPL